MKNKIFIVLLGAAGFFAACAQSKKTTGSPAGTSAASHDYTSFRLIRTGCFGRCPAYSITVFQDGRAQYSGKKNTPFTGVYEKNGSPAMARALFDTISKYRPDTCQASYPMRVADLPGMICEFTYRGKNYTILNANFGPAFLKSIGTQLDAAWKPDNSWTKISGAANDQ